MPFGIMINNHALLDNTRVLVCLCAALSVIIVWIYNATLHKAQADCRLCLTCERISQFLCVPTTQLLDCKCQFERRYEHSEQPT